MKTKTNLLRLSAIGLWTYAGAMLARKILGLTNLWWTWADSTINSIVIFSFATLALASVALACFALYGMRCQMPTLDTISRVLLHLSGWTMVICTIDVLLDLFPIDSYWFVYVDRWVLIGQSIVVGFILWRIGSQSGAESLPKGLPSVLRLAGIANCAVILLIVVAALYVAFTGHVFGFRTYNWITLVTCLTGSAILPWFAVFYSKSAKE